MNHCFASSQRVLTGDVLHEAIVEINQRRFAGIYEVIREGDNWRIHHELGYNYGFSCWLRTKRKVEFRPEMGDWAHWVTAVFQAEIAAKFKGKCSDEGIPDIWVPDMGKFLTFKAYWDLIHRETVLEPEQVLEDARWARTFSRIPEVLRQFVE